MTTKKISLILTLLVGITFVFEACGPQKAEEDSEVTVVTDSTATDAAKEKEQKIASPRMKAEGDIDGVRVTVDYGSPGVKGREIWGGLEPYGKVWRAGANETTSVEFSDDVSVGGEDLAAGKYGVYIIPNKDAEWTVIFNTDWDREKHGAWGAYNYTEENDVLRINITPEWSEESKERLEYQVANDAITFAWEKARLSIPVAPKAE